MTNKLAGPLHELKLQKPISQWFSGYVSEGNATHVSSQRELVKVFVLQSFLGQPSTPVLDTSVKVPAKSCHASPWVGVRGQTGRGLSQDIVEKFHFAKHRYSK